MYIDQDQFKLQKQAARASAVHDYYGWRMDKEFDEAIVSQLEQNKAQLSVDAKIVREHGNRLRSTLPALRARHQELAQELRQERERQAAIEACEPGTLKELYEAIDEQK